jgi:hypothetical protein
MHEAGTHWIINASQTVLIFISINIFQSERAVLSMNKDDTAFFYKYRFSSQEQYQLT